MPATLASARRFARLGGSGGLNIGVAGWLQPGARRFANQNVKGAQLTKQAILRPAVAVSSVRRTLLLTAPAVATLAVLPGGAHATSSVANVGLVLPATERVNGSRAGWLQGFLHEQQALGVMLPVARTVYANGPSAVRAAARQLLEAGCTTIAGWADVNAVADFAPTLERYGARFLVSDLGAKSPRGEVPASVLRSGVDLWRRAHAAGSYLAAQGARTALVATSFYESGFDLVGAFEHGFRAAGGERVEIIVTGTPERSHGDRAWKRLGRKHRGFIPDAVFALYSGDEASEFFAFATHAHAPARLRNRPLLVLSPALDGHSALTMQAAARLPLQVMHTRSTDLTGADNLYSLAGRAAARHLLRHEAADYFATIAWHGAPGEESRVAATCHVCTYAPHERAGWLLPYGA